MSSLVFYVRVTNVTNFVSLGLVGLATDFKYFKQRIQKVFPPDEYMLDDLHQLAPSEIRCVHPDCKGILTDDCKSLFVESINKPLL